MGVNERRVVGESVRGSGLRLWLFGSCRLGKDKTLVPVGGFHLRILRFSLKTDQILSLKNAVRGVGKFGVVDVLALQRKKAAQQQTLVWWYARRTQLPSFMP